MTRLFLFYRVDFFTRVGNVAGVNGVQDEKLQNPDDIGGVFYIAGLLETLERSRLRVVCPIERADDDKSGIGIALEFLKLANGVVDTELGGFARSGDDLEVIEANDRGFGFIGTMRLKPTE